MTDNSGNDLSNRNTDASQCNHNGQAQAGSSWANNINDILRNNPQPTMRPIMEGFSLDEKNSTNEH